MLLYLIRNMKKKFCKIPISDNTLSRRIQDMSQDVESLEIANIKEAFFCHLGGGVK
jgi:hypothetical protein